jgi:ribosomal protein S14
MALQNILVERSNRENPVRCARCGADRVIPLTVSFPRSEHRLAQRHRPPVRAEVKCIACGHRTHVHPKLLLAS